MSETIPTREGVLGTEPPKTPPAQSETTTMGIAFQELAQKLGVESGKDVATAIKERGAIAGDDIGERASASVINFPLERKRTKDDQRRLGSEVGLSAGQFIGEHVQNNMKKVLGGTISTMEEGEKTPNSAPEKPDLAKIREETASMPPQLEARTIALIDRIEELQKNVGNEQEIVELEAKLQGIYSEGKAAKIDGGIKPKPELVNPPIPPEEKETVLNKEKDGSTETWSPFNDLVLRRIQRELERETRKIKGAAGRLRDPAQEPEPLNKIIALGQKRQSQLSNELEQYIQNKIQALSPEEVEKLRNTAQEAIRDEDVYYKTGPILVSRYIRSRLEEESAQENSRPISDEENAELDREILEINTPDVATHLKVVGLSETEQVVAKSETITPVTEVAPKETTEDPRQPATAEEAPSPTKQESPYDLAMKKIAAEDPARAERLLNAIGTTPEQRERIEKLLGATQAFEERTNAIEKEKDPWVVEHALKIGEWYRTIPLKKKLIASAFLIGGASALAASGGAGAAMIATAAFTGSAFQRILGGLAVASAVEGVLTKRSIARNEEEERILGMRMNVILGALAGTGVFLGGKLLGDYLSSGGEQAVEAPPTPKETPVEPPKESLETSPQTEYTEKVESVREVLKSEALVQQPYTVQEGDKLWNILKEKLPGVQSLAGEEAKQSNTIANIIEQIKKDPASFGITGGNVDNLNSGDVLNMEKIHSVLENTKISVGGAETTILERAEGLTDTEISTIEANNEKLAEWQAEHPGEQLTTETTDKILSEPSGAETPSENFDNIRKDMETAEAISMKTEQIFRADIQTMFGSKGLFGYGFLGTNGERSVDWLDLKDRTVDEVMTKKFEGEVLSEEGGVTKFGIDSFGAVDKIKGYMNMLIERTGLTPEKTESVDHFVHRAIHSIASK